MGAESLQQQSASGSGFVAVRNIDEGIDEAIPSGEKDYSQEEVDTPEDSIAEDSTVDVELQKYIPLQFVSNKSYKGALLAFREIYFSGLVKPLAISYLLALGVIIVVGSAGFLMYRNASLVRSDDANIILFFYLF
jgi:hypothetical protein